MRSTLVPVSAVLALALATPAWAGPRVVLTREEWLALQPPDEPKPAPGPGPVAGDRDVVLEPIADGLRIHARWRIEAPDHQTTAWFDQLVVGPMVRIESATLDGKPAPLVARDGGVGLNARVNHPMVLAIDAFLPGDPERDDLAFHLMPAARGRLTVHGTDLEPSLSATDGPVVRARDGFRTVASDLVLHLAARQPPVERTAIALADVGIGLTVGDAELSGRAHLVWHVRQGKLSEVAFTATGVGADLAISGEDVGEWHRDGDRITIALRSPDDPEIAVDLVWSQGVPGGEDVSLPVPSIVPEASLHTETVLQLARDSEIEVVPQSQGWEPVASSALPVWAKGLITGTPTASFRVTQGGGSLELLRFTPVEEPACVVDVANYTVATSDEGRTLIRAYLEVRNERAAALRVIPPAGHTLIAVQVSGAPVVPGTDDGPGWLVPLPRSLETVEGMLSFPIEVIVLGETTPWDHREDRTLDLLRYDAPVALSRLTLHLPPGYASRSKPGDGDEVADFTEGETITYGQAVGDVASAAADAKFQEAVSDWMRNDFDSAQAKLDELRSLGADTENVKKLQSNLDVVSGNAPEKGDDVMSRRVKEQAQARALEDTRAQDEALQQAQEAERAGDYAAASSAYNQAIEIGDKLAKIQQNESVDISAKNASASSGLAVVEKAKEKREEIEQSGQQQQAPEPDVARITLSEDYLQNIPAGRTYESTLQTLPGVAAGRGEGKKGRTITDDEDADGLPDQSDQAYLGPYATTTPETPATPPAGAYSFDGVEIHGEVSGVPGGVVGGVLGGVQGGVAGESLNGLALGITGSGEGGGGNANGEPPTLPEPMQPAPVATPPEPEPPPEYYDNDMTEELDISEARRRVRIPLPHLAMAKKPAPVEADEYGGYTESYGAYGDGQGAGAAGQGPAEVQPLVLDREETTEHAHLEVVAGEEEGPPQVSAAAMTVLVPALGKDVRFQHLLLPPDDTWTVTLAARSED